MTTYKNTRVEVSVATKNGPLACEVLEDFGELVITITPGENGALLPYTLTHVRTGFAVMKDRSRKRLIDLARRLAGLNWEFSNPEESLNLEPSVLPILASWRAGLETESA